MTQAEMDIVARLVEAAWKRDDKLCMILMLRLSQLKTSNRNGR